MRPCQLTSAGCRAHTLWFHTLAVCKPGFASLLQVARCIPWTIHNYHLEELITVPELRRNIAALFRKYADVQSPEVIDLLVYKGRGELEVRGKVAYGVRQSLLGSYVHLAGGVT